MEEKDEITLFISQTGGWRLRQKTDIDYRFLCFCQKHLTHSVFVLRAEEHRAATDRKSIGEKELVVTVGKSSGR